MISSVKVTPTGASAASTVVSATTYLPFGPLSSYALGSGQTVTRAYDANYHVTDIASPAFTLHLARDLMGDVSAIGPASGANPATETYAYDPLYRLGSVTEANGSVLESYTYNPTGDRLSKTGSGLGVGSYTYASGTHQLNGIGNAARTSDANGNTTASARAGQAWGYGYNGRNRLTVVQANGVTVGTYTYNALGQRIQKVATSPAAITQRYAYDELGHLVGEYTSANSRDTIWMGDIPVATVDTAGSTSTGDYVTADQLGTPRAVSDANGTAIWSWPYVGNAFEELTPTSVNGYVLNLRSAGEYFDVETGLNSNGYRTREQASWRFLQSDPIGLAGGINTYAAVGNNPLDFIDPLGLAQCSLVFANGKGTMQCSPDDPSHPSVNIPVASGNNGGGKNCKNNLDCQDEVGHGPIPSGCWQWTNGYTGKPNGRVLQPCPGWPDHGRSNIRSHSCANAFGPSKVPPFCSDGCVTGSAEDIQSLNKLLDSEPNSTLWVGSSALQLTPSFDSSLPGRDRWEVI